MPRAPKICSYVGPEGSCSECVPCPLHPKVAWKGSTRRTELPPNWEKLRRKVLLRDPVCTDGRVCQRLALSTDCHHIAAKTDHALENLAGVCRACHKAITSEQAAEARTQSR